jgi:hypothetical protein
MGTAGLFDHHQPHLGLGSQREDRKPEGQNQDRARQAHVDSSIFT